MTKARFSIPAPAEPVNPAEGEDALYFLARPTPAEREMQEWEAQVDLLLASQGQPGPILSVLATLSEEIEGLRARPSAPYRAEQLEILTSVMAQIKARLPMTPRTLAATLAVGPKEAKR